MSGRDAFTEQVRQALANPVLQTALDGNAERRLNAIDAAFAQIPEGRPELRRRAHQMKAEVVAHLPELLEQFIQKVEQNGIIVHRAADAAQAVSIVLEIAVQHHARLAAKSKSMVSEEIRLNPALEKAGIRPVETDLGEYIVQLRKEPPAHIITPAVHLTRREVGELFAEELGIPFTEDIPVLTATARKVLRQTFLDADIGLSGVNVGVAETGTLCLVTNEGNGRMCTTVPPVHIALMGIERLAPTMDDLALILRMLPRSATGQTISVYTSLIHSPKRKGEAGTIDTDGPLERHLVLIDNGRLRLRGSPLEEALYCIRCGACLNACPVFREIGGHSYRGLDGHISAYPGPIGSVISPGLFGYDNYGHLARVSSLCGACKDACPVDIDLPKLLLRVRAGMEPGMESQSHAVSARDDAGSIQHSNQHSGKRHTPWGLKLFLSVFTWFGSQRGRFRLAQQLAGGFSKIAGRSGWLRLPKLTGWGLSRDLPAFASRPFHSRFEHLETEPAAPRTIPPPSNRTSIPASPPETPATVSTPLQLAQPGDAALIERFTAELIALGGKVIPCTAAEAANTIQGLLEARGITGIQAWSAENLPAGLVQTLEQGGISISVQPDPDLPAGLTGAIAGVAETGSLVVASGSGRPLTASLLPPLHIAVLNANEMLPNLEQALALPALQKAAAAVLISGPSRTADIEMTLTIGVHGPGELLVILIQ